MKYDLSNAASPNHSVCPENVSRRAEKVRRTCISELSVKAVRDSRNMVGRRLWLCYDCSSESKVNTKLPAPPLAFSMRAPLASRPANVVPTDRCDLQPSGVFLCPIRPSTSCSPANWPSSLHARARAPPGSVCSELFLGL